MRQIERINYTGSLGFPIEADLDGRLPIESKVKGNRPVRRNSISRHCRDLIRYLNPCGGAFIERCRSMPFAMLDLKGERIELAFSFKDEFSLRRAERLGRRRCDNASPAIGRRIAMRRRDNLLIFDVLVLSP